MILIDAVVTWVIAGLITVLIAVVGYFLKVGSKILLNVNEFMQKQIVKNEVNEKAHSDVRVRLNSHSKQLDNHERRITTIEVRNDI
jgi:Tfp pilus assembly protein PilO